MGNWNDIHNEFIEGEVKKQKESTSDSIRRKYLKALSELTGRNTIAYYSGWLQRPGQEFSYITQITDEDKQGFMSCFMGCKWDRGLDLVLHLPGGSVAATETIIDYIRAKFGHNIRAIVPQISMSGGTMLACAGREIVMGTHSNLGPIDPQFGSMPAIAILEEFDRAMQDVQADPNRALLWQAIIGQYPPTLLSQAKQAIEWSREIGKKALKEGMFKNAADPDAKANEIIEFLLSQNVHRAHGRHIHRKDLQDKGLHILELESDPALQDAVLSVHHAYVHTLMNTNAIKIIENHDGVAVIKTVAIRIAPAPTPQQQPAVPPPAPHKQNVPGFIKRIFLAIRFIFFPPRH